MPHILMIGLLLGGEVVPVHPVSGTWFESRAACEKARTHPSVIASYADVFPGREVRFWCEPVRK